MDDIYEILKERARQHGRGRATPLPKGWRSWYKPGVWVVVYTNPYASRREVTRGYFSAREAEECADFLRFQGAQRIRIEKIF